MNILVFGGAGYIGAHVVIELLENGHSVMVFDNFSTGEKLNVDKRAKIFTGDILSKNDLKKVFQDNKFNAVMHFCALKAPGESMFYPDVYSEVNITGSINILNEMLKNNISKFIFSSSSSVYGEPKNKYINEDHSLNPLSYYGFTKLEVERILKWYSHITNIRFVSLRYFNAAGYDIYSRIKVPEKRSPNLIPKIMDVITKKEKILKIFGNDYNTKDGTCIRDFIHVTDLANAHIASLDFLNRTSKKALFLNLATGKGHTVLEVIKKVEKLSGIKVNYKISERRKGDPSIVVSKTKYKNFPLDWKPINSNLKTIIKSVLSIYKIEIIS